MDRPRRLPLFLLDALGAGLLAVALATAFWLIFVRGERAADEIKDLTQSVDSATQDVAALRSAVDRQRATLKERQTELAGSGQLPAQVALEEYFQTLSGLAAKHQLRIVRQNPLPPRTYPGLLEQRYAYEVVGTMPDIARFFKAIEDAEFWADVSFLKIDGGPRKGDQLTDEHVASLTISLFSALRAEAESGNG